MPHPDQQTIAEALAAWREWRRAQSDFARSQDAYYRVVAGRGDDAAEQQAADAVMAAGAAEAEAWGKARRQLDLAAPLAARTEQP